MTTKLFSIPGLTIERKVKPKDVELGAQALLGAIDEIEQAFRGYELSMTSVLKPESDDYFLMVVVKGMSYQARRAVKPKPYGYWELMWKHIRVTVG